MTSWVRFLNSGLHLTNLFLFLFSFFFPSFHLFLTERGSNPRCRCLSSTVFILCLSWLWRSFPSISGLLSSGSVLLPLFNALPCWLLTTACSPCVVGPLERSYCAKWFSVCPRCVVALGQFWWWSVVWSISNLGFFFGRWESVRDLCVWLELCVMEDSTSSVNIEKLCDSNYHAWKQKMFLVWTLEDLYHFLN